MLNYYFIHFLKYDITESQEINLDERQNNLTQVFKLQL